LRVALGDGPEVWRDILAGPSSGPVAPSGDLVVRDRNGHWTYGFCVVVDDLRQGVDLVIRGRDLVRATPAQIRLARLLGRSSGPAFLHHPLVHRPDGSKLSKSSGDTGVRELRASGLTAQAVFGMVVGAFQGRDAAVPNSAAAAWALLSGSDD
jgi:glutamyl/glutaminyl-tRNA synthetase